MFAPKEGNLQLRENELICPLRNEQIVFERNRIQNSGADPEGLEVDLTFRQGIEGPNPNK